MNILTVGAFITLYFLYLSVNNKVMINNKESHELEMRYEGLATAILESERGNDPWAISDANFFSFEVREESTLVPAESTRENLHTIIDVAIWKHKNNSGFVEKLGEFKKAVSKMMTQDEASDIVDGLIVLAEEIGY